MVKRVYQCNSCGGTLETEEDVGNSLAALAAAGWSCEFDWEIPYNGEVRHICLTCRAARQHSN